MLIPWVETEALCIITCRQNHTHEAVEAFEMLVDVADTRSLLCERQRHLMRLRGDPLAPGPVGATDAGGCGCLCFDNLRRSFERADHC